MPSDTTAEELNFNFNFNMVIARKLAVNLKYDVERQNAIRWIKYLSTCHRTQHEMKLRNEYMFYLIKSMQSGVLSEPFNAAPHTGPLPDFDSTLPGGLAWKHIRTGAVDVMGTPKWKDQDSLNKEGPTLYQKSPDGGAFFAAQPIPKCGAFCYLAVTAKPNV